MNDPHVKALCYRAVVAEGVHFVDPPPLQVVGLGFSGTLADGSLTCYLQEHHSTVSEARARVEPFLRTWEVSAGLALRGPCMTFVFENAEVIDREPVPGSLPPLTAREVGTVSTGLDASIVVERPEYIPPLGAFIASPDVISLWQRFAGYRARHEPLLSMAYFCLTVAERDYAGRKAASRALKIRESVLSKLAELSSVRGDALSARKAHRLSKPLTEAERQWLEEAVIGLIKRMGEVVAGAPVEWMSLDSLPKLKSEGSGWTS